MTGVGYGDVLKRFTARFRKYGDDLGIDCIVKESGQEKKKETVFE
jgi:hypothetical protein